MENKQITNEHITKVLAMFQGDSELESNPQFKKYVQKVLDECYNRPAAPAGKRYIRGAWDYFKENGMFITQNFLHMNNAIKMRIGQKRPMAVREYAKAIMNEATRRTFIHYAQIEANTEQSK